MSHHHENPFLSILLGSAFSIGAYFTEHNFIIENAVSLFKVIFFGIVGGASGYMGREVMIEVRKRIKEKRNS